MKRRLPLIVVGLWLVLVLVWPLISPPSIYIEPHPMHSIGPLVKALDMDVHFDQAAEVLGKTKKPWRQWWDRVWRILNFLILAWLLFKLLREPTKKFFSTQHQTRQEELAQFEAAKAAAQADFQAVQDKLSHLSQEIGELEAGFAERAKRLRASVMEQAKFESEMILRKAREAAEARSRKAQQRLRQEIVELAAERAEQVLRRAMTADDHRRLFDEYLSGLTTQPGG